MRSSGPTDNHTGGFRSLAPPAEQQNSAGVNETFTPSHSHVIHESSLPEPDQQRIKKRRRTELRAAEMRSRSRVENQAQGSRQAVSDHNEMARALMPPPAERTAGSQTRFDYQGSRSPYEEDKSLIEDFRLGAEMGGTNLNTIDAYRYRLIDMSDWLRRNNKGSMKARLFTAQLETDLKLYAREHGYTDISALLKHVYTLVMDRNGRLKINPRRIPENMHVPEEDHWLIEQAFPKDEIQGIKVKTSYRQKLIAFSDWLTIKHNMSLCDFLERPEVEKPDILPFSQGHSVNQQIINAALRRIKEVNQGGEVGIRRIRRRDEAYDVDSPLLEEFEARMNQRLHSEAQRNQRPVSYDHKGRTAAYSYTSTLRRFSIWLRQNNKPDIQSRIHQQSLEIDKDIWMEGKSKNSMNPVNTALRRLRDCFPRQTQPTQSDSFQLPGSDWSGWHFDPDHDEVGSSAYSAMAPETGQGNLRAADDNVSDSFQLPGSDWSGWHFDPDHDEAGSSAYSAMAPDANQARLHGDGVDLDLNSDAEVTGPARAFERAPAASTGMTFNSLSSLRGDGVDLDLNSDAEVTGPVAERP